MVIDIVPFGFEVLDFQHLWFSVFRSYGFNNLMFRARFLGFRDTGITSCLMYFLKEFRNKGFLFYVPV